MATIALIDDESKPRKLLRGLIEASKLELEVVGEANSVKTGIALIQQVKPQIILLDVEMKDGTGFDLLQQVKGHRPHVIFVTAFDHYAVRAFRTNAIDFIQKPIHPSHLKEAFDKVIKSIQQEQAPNYPTVFSAPLQGIKQKIAVPTRYGKLYIKTGAILYVKADGGYSEMHVENSTTPHLISRRLQQVEQTLEGFGFVRIHRSYLINVSKILQLSKTDGGFVILENGTEIPFSKHYKESGFQKIQELTTHL